MDGQLYSAGGWGPDTSQDGARRPAWDVVEPVSAWPLASQILQLLGEDGELDSSFFEESWTSGLPPAVERRQERSSWTAAQDVQGCTFAELRGLGTFRFSMAEASPREGSPLATRAMPTAAYTADWLQEPSPARTRHQASPGNAAACNRDSGNRDSGNQDGGDQARGYPAQDQHAWELLGVSEHSTEAQIKAGYRRMVGRWHPDRLERGSEEQRELATKQMAAINGAYRLLRSRRPMEASFGRS